MSLQNALGIKSNQLKNLGKGMLKDIKSNKELNDRIDALQKNLNKVEKGNWTWKTIFNFYDKDSPESKWIREIWKLRGKRAKEHGSIGRWTGKQIKEFLFPTSGSDWSKYWGQGTGVKPPARHSKAGEIMQLKEAAEASIERIHSLAEATP